MLCYIAVTLLCYTAALHLCVTRDTSHVFSKAHSWAFAMAVLRLIFLISQRLREWAEPRSRAESPQYLGQWKLQSGLSIFTAGCGSFSTATVYVCEVSVVQCVSCWVRVSGSLSAQPRLQECRMTTWHPRHVYIAVTGFRGNGVSFPGSKSE